MIKRIQILNRIDTLLLMNNCIIIEDLYYLIDDISRSRVLTKKQSDTLKQSKSKVNDLFKHNYFIGVESFIIKECKNELKKIRRLF